MSNYPAPEPAVDLRQYLRPVWARRWQIIAMVALVTIATYAYYDHKPKRYEASATIFIQASELEQSLFGVLSPNNSARTTANQARLLKTEGVANEVGDKIRYRGDPLALLDGVTTKTDAASDFITIEANADSPRSAAAIANGFATAFITVRARDARRKVQRALKSAREDLSRLPRIPGNQDAREAAETQIRRLQIALGLPAGSAELTQRAVAPSRPFTPTPARDALFAFVLSLLFAITVALGLERLDRRVRNVEELEEIFGLPVLAVLPGVPRTSVFDHDDAVVPHGLREASRSLRLNVDLGSPSSNHRTILVTSALSGEGKSTVVRSLAVTYAEAGRSVVVLEADLRRPSLSEYFHIAATPGLTDVLANEVALGDAEQGVNLHTDGGGELVVITAGPQPANPPAVLGSQQVRDVLARLTERFDVVIIDTPPVLLVSDALPLLNEVDCVLLVSRMGLTTRDAARRLLRTVHRVPEVHVVGVVANDVEIESAQNYLYYGPYGRPDAVSVAPKTPSRSASASTR